MERETLAALYGEYGPVVYRRALALLKNGDEARDAMQEVFVRVVAEHGQFRGEVPVLRWMYRITTNLCLNRIRQRRAHPVVSDPEAIMALVEGRGGDQVDRASVLEILAKMDEATQQIAIYYVLDEMSMEEIAETIGLSRKTVSKKLEAFRKKARSMLTVTAVRA